MTVVRQFTISQVAPDTAPSVAALALCSPNLFGYGAMLHHFSADTNRRNVA